MADPHSLPRNPSHNSGRTAARAPAAVHPRILLREARGSLGYSLPRTAVRAPSPPLTRNRLQPHALRGRGKRVGPALDQILFVARASGRTECVKMEIGDVGKVADPLIFEGLEKLDIKGCFFLF